MGTRTLHRPSGSDRLRRTTAAAAALAIGLSMAACSGDDEGDKDDGGGDQDHSAETDRTTLAIHPGKVAGSLQPAKQKVAVKVVGTVVDRWLRAAYVDGDYPRTRFPKAKTYPGFTKELAVRAARDRNLTSNAGIGKRIDGVTGRRIVVVDLLAPKNRIAGATARIRLMLDTSGDLERRVLVTGRVGLVRVKSGQWRIFSYDLSRSTTAIPAPGERKKPEPKSTASPSGKGAQ